MRCCAAFLLVIPMACSEEVQAACSGGIELIANGALTVAADYSYPPFAFRGPEGDLIGYDVDVIEAIAKEMKLKTRFVNRGAGQLVAGALAHRHDVAASGLRSTSALRREMCVTSGYLDADLGVLVPAPNPLEIDTVSALADKTVGVLERSEGEIWARQRLASSTLASLPTTDDLLTGVRQGELDAVVADHIVVRFAARESKDFRVSLKIPTEESYAFVAAPNNAGLVAGMNRAIATLRRTGVLKRTERKWLGA